MPTLHELQEDIKRAKKKLEATHQKIDEFTAIAQSTEDYLNLLVQLEPMVKNNADEPLNENDPNYQNGRKRAGKSNVQVIEEIISLQGRPMHITDILNFAEKMGVEFKGNNDPKIQLRNALNGAKKRFYNLGNNTWWLMGRPEPGTENTNGSRPDQPVTQRHQKSSFPDDLLTV